MDIEARIFYVKSHMYQFGVAEPPAKTAHPNRMAVLPCGWGDLFCCLVVKMLLTH